MSEKYWTDDKLDWLREHSNGIPRAEILVLYNKAFNENIKKSQLDGAMNRYFINCNVDCKFKKGKVAVNKGKTIYEYMKPESIERMRATQFKVGDNKWHFIGDVYLKTKHGKKQPYIRIGKHWSDEMLYARYVWEKETGDKLIPDDYIIHLDGDYQNCNIDNLMKVRKDDHLRIIKEGAGDGYIKGSAELNKAHILTNQLIGAVGRKANGRSKV